jgi:protease secretion system membrane fusion protein
MKLLKNETTAVVVHDVTPLEVNTDAKAYSRIGWLIVLFGIGGILLWLFFAPLDKGVPLSGTVAKESNRKAIQHPTGGIVQEILVKDGDVVKAGQVLVRMNATGVRSAFDTSEAQYLTARVAEARLLAERDGLKNVVYPQELVQRKNEPRIAELMMTQNQLFTSRQMSLQSQLGSMDENIAGLKVQIKSLQESRESVKSQMAFLKEQLDGMRDLAKEGYIARNRLLDLERTYAQLSGQMAEDIGSIGRTQRQVMEVSLKRTQAQQEYQKEVRSQLSDVEREAEALSARLQSQSFDVANNEVKSPVDGTVTGLAIFTNGGVVQPGFKMMEVVPTNDPMIIEGNLAVNLIDRVHPGLKTELNFAAFNRNKTPQVEGEVIEVGADRLVEERNGNPYYKVRVRVTPEGQKKMAAAHLDIRPGMPVELFVNTGERTMANYLMKPILDRAHSALTEE